jgi:hypothetical protein
MLTKYTKDKLYIKLVFLYTVTSRRTVNKTHKNIKIYVLRVNMMEIRNELAKNSGWKKDLAKLHFERLNLADCVLSLRSALNRFRMVCNCASSELCR